ncbi:hypothetical protein DICPUDRAFT_156265 [Dictyostelium purpureum]|uniref:CHCH domain-containing protein n=1 Tax=Dictyostelium purpureum TaxID=5786 RepID=F0ZW51_DICPU|nr:uncharacterized protein DICPUDRAFT_156265 [Dictyostelium purpureum]EGC31819.1 hypothetical protein DICPUDRAFT_156265 [Dictyostelium purpureum]|eukprot:XP_003291653.1 hypothetical protein DICPUDRAFT_156265 [Dictyostelium purpureum]
MIEDINKNGNDNTSTNNEIIDQIKINENIFSNFKYLTTTEFENSKKEIQQLDEEHNLIFNQYLPKEYKESPCINKEKKLIECLISKNKDFILCSDILNEFAKCQEKYIREYNK